MIYKIFEQSSPDEKKRSCKEIITQLPGWFGIAEANENYINNLVDKDVFVASKDNETLGAIAIKYHFSDTAEIWWMGVDPRHHRNGIGTLLFEAALNKAKENNCKWIVLETLSPISDDKFYQRTRDFYIKIGFKPLLSFNESDPVNPMIWMIYKIY